jgi:hypothetical protein
MHQPVMANPNFKDKPGGLYSQVISEMDFRVEAGQEWAGFWSLLYASFYDESRIQDR